MLLGILGIIGFGNMGSAIVKGLINANIFMPSDIHVVDIDEEKLASAKADGHFTHSSVEELGELSNTIMVAVKPKDVPGVLQELRNISDDTLIISIAAGVPIREIEAVLGQKPVIRVMPNTPCMVGAGVSVISRGSKATDADFEKARTILSSVGFVSEAPESLMDAVTGLSGSGPAYMALMIDALSDGGVKMGLPRNTALKLAVQTMFGTAKMILEKGIHPARLRDMVASPGGTTIEGISALEAGGFRAALIKAVEMASLKSKELSS
jgi:pyrroline-5-carboxylate reductase